MAVEHRVAVVLMSLALAVGAACGDDAAGGGGAGGQGETSTSTSASGSASTSTSATTASSTSAGEGGQAGDGEGGCCGEYGGSENTGGGDVGDDGSVDPPEGSIACCDGFCEEPAICVEGGDVDIHTFSCELLPDECAGAGCGCLGEFSGDGGCEDACGVDPDSVHCRCGEALDAVCAPPSYTGATNCHATGTGSVKLLCDFSP